MDIPKIVLLLLAVSVSVASSSLWQELPHQSSIIIRDRPIGEMSPICARALGGYLVADLISIVDSLPSPMQLFDLNIRYLTTRSHSQQTRAALRKQLYRIRNGIMVQEQVYHRMINFNQDRWGLATSPTSEILRWLVGSQVQTSGCEVHKWYNEVFLEMLPDS